MRELLVAIFDTPTKTDRAIEALHASGISDTAIRRYHKDDPAIPYGARSHTTTEVAPQTRPHETSGGFWSWLLGEEGATTEQDYERDHGLYGRAVEAGNTVIAVTVEQADVRRIMDVLADHVPDELQDAGAVEPRAQDTTRLGTAHDVSATRDAAALGTAHAAPITQHERPSEEHVRQSRAGETEEVIPLAEEDVSVSTRQVDRGTTRIRRYVVATPVERQVNLRQEHVEIERRTPTGASTVGEGAFEERTVEVRDTTEEPVVSKTARVAEEVVVHKEVTETPTTVQETVRREAVEVSPDNNARATVTDHTATPTDKTPTPSDRTQTDKPHT